MSYVRHLKPGLIASMSALLLSACTGTLPNLSEAPAADDQKPGNGGDHAKSKRMRVTSRDILSEWSTFGIEPRPLKRKRMASATPLRDAIETPNYTLTIDQITANALCRSCEDKPYHQLVVNASNRHGVPVGLIHAVIQKESGYKATATSKKSARGLMQVTPQTARFVGVSNSHHLYDPQTNINAGTAYLKYLMANHDTMDEVLAAYNSGPGNVRKYNGVPPFDETRRYVRDVKKLYVSTSRE